MNFSRKSGLLALVTVIGLVAFLSREAVSAQALDPLVVRNASGLRLISVPNAPQPTLRVVLPGSAESDRSIEILVPEHVTAVRHGETTAEHLFLPGDRTVERPTWHLRGHALEYELTLPGPVQMLVRATIDHDGVRFRYKLNNRSDSRFDMIVAVTDPRLTGVFHDQRLERTYVHHAQGFDLLASDFPDRLTRPLDTWLPARVLASFNWPVPAQRIESRADGITYYHKARAVDFPLVMTRSTGGDWVVASFSRTAGNVWSNPALTCQHVDPQAPLEPRRQVVLEVKMLVIQGSLDDALRLAVHQKNSLK